MTAWFVGDAIECRNPATAASGPSPTIKITAPVEGQSVAGTCTVTVDVPPDQTITHVTVYRDGEPIGSDFSAPYEIAWDTRWDHDGPHQLTATASGERVVDLPPAKRTVIVDNTPPTVTLTAPKNDASVGATVTLQADASDIVGIGAVKFLLNGREFASISKPPYQATWNTEQGPNGHFAIEARAFDLAGNGALSAAAVVRVTNPNRPPIILPMSSKLVQEAQELTFTVSVVDPDGPRDPLTTKASNLPEWATFDPKTLVFKGTPPSTEASLTQPTKVYPNVRFETCDPEPLCASQQISITVQDVNRPPVLVPPGDRVINEGQLLTMTLIMSDPDGDALTCKVERLLPWASFDASTCRLEGTPDFDVASLDQPTVVYLPMRFEVCDSGGLCASAISTVTVANVDTTPVLQPIGRKEIDEGRQLKFDVLATDANSDEVTLKAEPLPKGATFVDHLDGTGTFTWTPGFDQGGDYALKVSVSDEELSSQEIVPIAVRQSSLVVSGAVLEDLTHTPIEGVSIQLLRGGDVVTETTTDAKGAYFIKDIKPGTYTIRPSYTVTQQFSGQARKGQAARFDPVRHQVTLTDKDQKGLDFSVAVE